MLLQSMVKCVEEILRGKGLLEEWRKGIIKPIYMKGDKTDLGNYRGIMIMGTGYEIYAEWLRKRLVKELND